MKKDDSRCLESLVKSIRNIITYDRNYKENNETKQHEYTYDSHGRVIYAKSTTGSESWYVHEVDGKSVNFIRTRITNEDGSWIEYDIELGMIYHQKDSNGKEIWYQYGYGRLAGPSSIITTDNLITFCTDDNGVVDNEKLQKMKDKLNRPFPKIDTD